MYLNQKYYFIAIIRAVVLAIGAGICVMASAETLDTFHPYAAFTEAYDANLLDLPNSAAAQQILGSSNTADRSHTELIGVSFDDQIGLQHLTADVNRSKTSYDRFTALDYSADSLKANWNWALGSHLYGNLGASYVESIGSYAYFHVPVVNLVTQRNQNADIDWLFHPRWRAVASFTGYQSQYDAVAEQPYNKSEYHALVGIDYLEPRGSTIGVQAVHARGYFPFPQQFGDLSIVNNYVQDEIKAKIDWRFSDKTRLQFLGGWVERKFDSFDEQNYRGLNGRVIADWAPTGKLTINAAAWHEIAAINVLSVPYSVNHGASIAPSWFMTDKLRWDLQYQVEVHSLAPLPQLFDGPIPDITYLIHSTSLMLTYSPTQHWNIQTSIYHQNQATSDHSNDFTGSGVMCSTRYQF